MQCAVRTLPASHSSLTAPANPQSSGNLASFPYAETREDSRQQILGRERSRDLAERVLRCTEFFGDEFAGALHRQASVCSIKGRQRSPQRVNVTVARHEGVFASLRATHYAFDNHFFQPGKACSLERRHPRRPNLVVVDSEARAACPLRSILFAYRDARRRGGGRGPKAPWPRQVQRHDRRRPRGPNPRRQSRRWHVRHPIRSMGSDVSRKPAVS